MLITYATRSFLYGYILTIFVNSTSSALVYFLCNKCCLSYLEKKYHDNVLVMIIRKEALAKPVKVSFLFRFMNIPGLYKNLGLILAKTVPFIWYIIPTIIESIISNAFICMLA